jgi:hypothetical protein
MVVRVESIRSMSSPVGMMPRSWAASVERSPMPMLVGEVRCATLVGVSWKLSAGRK